MAGAVGIVFGLCVLSFTLGAALMYIVLRRREDAASTVASSADSEAPAGRADDWVAKPAVVEPVADDYDSRPIHRNPVVGLPQMEPALAVLAEPVAVVAEPESAVRVEPLVGPGAEPVADVVELGVGPEPVLEVVAVPVSLMDADAELEPVAELEPEPVAAVLAEPEPAAELEPVAEQEQEPEPGAAAEAGPKNVSAGGYDRDGDLQPPLGELEAPESTVAPSTDSPVSTRLPGPSAPQPVEHATLAEREDFRQRYLRTFEEARRKASSN